MSRRSGGLVVFVVLVSAIGGSCGSSTSNGAANASGVAGSMVLSGACPVIRGATGCPDQPFTGSLKITNASGAQVGAIVRSDAHGDFRVPLAPGTYTLVPINPRPGVPPAAQPSQVQVTAGQYTPVVIRYDAGVR